MEGTGWLLAVVMGPGLPQLATALPPQGRQLLLSLPGLALGLAVQSPWAAVLSLVLKGATLAWRLRPALQQVLEWRSEGTA